MKRNWKLLVLKRLCTNKDKTYNRVLLDYFKDKFIEIKNKPKTKRQWLWKEFKTLFK